MEDQSKEQECCPEFDPGPWDHKTHEWVQKPFIKDYLPQFLHMPLPSMMGKTIGRMWKKTKKSTSIIQPVLNVQKNMGITI